MTYAVSPAPKAPRVAHHRARQELDNARFYEAFHGAEDCADDEHWDGDACRPGLCPAGHVLTVSGCVLPEDVPPRPGADYDEPSPGGGGGPRRVSPGSPPAESSTASVFGSYGFLLAAVAGGVALLYFARAR